jgi:hypothetical protein
MTGSVPIRDWSRNRIYYGKVLESDLRDLLDDMDDYLSGVRTPGATIEVRNGSGAGGVAASAAELLVESGFEVAQVGNADSFDYDHTIINYRAGAREVAEDVKHALDLATADLVEQRVWRDNPDLQLVVVLGDDFHAETLAADEIP